jgi:predicted metalloendopeptidase
MELGARWGREGLSGPMALSVIPDLGDSTRYMVYLFQAGLTLPDRDFYLMEGEKFEAIRAAMPDYVAAVFALGGVEDSASRSRAVLALETKIATIHWPAEETRNVEALYNLHEVADLGQVSSGIDWPGYLAAAGLAGQSQVVIAMPSYTEGLGTLLQSESLEDWKSYWAFRVLHDSANLLSDAFVQARFEFQGRLVNGLEEMQPRWRRGTQLIDALMGESVGRVYVERHFSPAAKARMETLVGNLVDAFGDAIDELEWMTDETKARAQEKRRKFATKIGYPDDWRDYSSLGITGADLLGNVRRASAFEYDRNLNKLSGPIDRGEWGMTPQTVNAYYDPTMNEIVFPAAILQPPFFFLEADDAANYGAIGAGIGHEIGHAFDDQGRKFDGDGNLSDWWSEDDARGFEERAARLVEQYNQYEPLEGLHVNGQLTLGENIGDLTGLTIAYAAYMKSLGGQEPLVIDGLTGPQRFFMGWAQVWRAKYRDEAIRQLLLSNPHSPPRARINGPLGHLPAFYAAFDVREGDGMWIPPDERVKIW